MEPVKSNEVNGRKSNGDTSRNFFQDSSPSEVLEDYLEDEKIQEELENFRELIQGEENLKVGTDDKYLMSFLWSTNCSSEEGFRRMSNYYKMKSDYAEYFCQSSPVDYMYLVRMKILNFLNLRDRKGRVVGICKQGNVDPTKMSFREMSILEDIGGHVFWVDERSMRAGGGVGIMDGSNCKWQIIKWATPRNVSSYVKRVKAFFASDYECHFIYPSFFISGPIALAWPLISNSDAAQHMHFHYQSLNSLHQHVEPKILPKEYGGYQPNETAYVNLEQFILENEYEMKEMMSYGYKPR